MQKYAILPQRLCLYCYDHVEAQKIIRDARNALRINILNLLKDKLLYLRAVLSITVLGWWFWEGILTVKLDVKFNQSKSFANIYEEDVERLVEENI